MLSGAEILDVMPRGKWLQVQTTQGWLLLNLGMGGEILLTRWDRQVVSMGRASLVQTSYRGILSNAPVHCSRRRSSPLADVPYAAKKRHGAVACPQFE